MLEKTYNDVVRYIQATTADEVEQVLAPLPDGVREGLAEEVRKFGDGHRYDPTAKRAYYFERQGTGVAVWCWNHVYRPHEAGELIYRVVSSSASLDENLANACFARATGRTVTHPRPEAPGESDD